MLPVDFNEKIIEVAVEKAEDKRVLILIPATKPCFYKYWSLMNGAEKKGIPYFILDPGQHYDELIGYGMREVNLKQRVGVDLKIRGDLSQKSAELFTKVRNLATYLKKRWPDITFMPYVNGDTLTTGLFPAAWMFATNEKVIQGEAGLRGMSPKFFNNLNEDDMHDFIEKQFNGEWNLTREEPFPEQYCTYVSAAATHTLFPPVELNREHLLREGYPKDSMHVVGNTVVDVINLKKKEKSDKSVFDVYPQLEKGEWLRIDIHRRGNLTERRFKAVIGATLKLAEKGYNIAFIELNATKQALDFYNLRNKLQNNENILFTPLWREYAHVIEFLESDHCWSILTDSGSMQEEMNELGKACMTCRFNTDRPETVFIANSNVLVPPLNQDFIASTVEHIYKDEELRKRMSNSKKLYGTDVANKIINIIHNLMKEKSNTFKWTHETLGLWKESAKLKYL